MKQNTIETGFLNAAAAAWIPPTATFASPPSSPATGSVYLFTDALPIGASFDSGGPTALAAGLTTYVTVPTGGTISAWNIVLDTGSCTITIWKIARGGAKPTAANSINTSGLSLSIGTAIHSTVLTGWTTTIATNSIIGINLKAAAMAKFASLARRF